VSDEAKATIAMKLTIGRLYERLAVWLKRPAAHKLASIWSRIELLFALVISKLLLDSRFANTRLHRRIYFDISRPDSLLLSNGQERFIVSAADKEIGKFLFINQEPFDFYKLELVIKLLGEHHKRRLLVDVGANVGSVCIPAIKRGLFLQAIAVEPEPLNFSLLTANIHLNDLGRKIVAHRCALGAIDGETLILELSASNFGDHRVKMNAVGHNSRVNASTVSVRSEKLDSIIPDIKADDTVIWVDTQGFEGYVLQGASAALAQRTPIVLEFWPCEMSKNDSYTLLKNALNRGGYKCFYNLERPTQMPYSNEALDDLYKLYLSSSHTGPGYTDLLLV
jgi:FkbM family methyltransferase